MVEVGVIVTLGTVLIILALIPTTAWIVPKVLYEDTHHDEEDDHPSEQSASRPA